MLQRITNFTLFVCILLITGCNDPDIEIGGMEPTVTFVNARDISNFISSKDIYLEISVDEDDLDEIRVVIIPSSELMNFTKEIVESLSSENMQIIDPSGQLNFGLRLEEIKDINGNDIKNDSEYTIGLVLMREGNMFISSRNTILTLTDVHPLIGKYIGERNDNGFSKFDIGIKINSYSNGELHGEMFYNSDFVPCCNGEQVGATNDGAIVLIVSEIDNTISSFHYIQDLPTLGDGCNGEFMGTGDYDQITFEINISYTGEDCDKDDYVGTYKFQQIFE